jgi:hypothetical protein
MSIEREERSNERKRERRKDILIGRVTGHCCLLMLSMNGLALLNV